MNSITMNLKTPSNQPYLKFLAQLTALAAFILIIAGGLVTSTGSGLAVPDWPLSFGQFFPAMAGGVFFEHGHRMIAGTVGLMTLILVVSIWLLDQRRWLRRLGLAAGGGVILQAFLGGLTVLMKLPPEVSIAHACLGQSVFCLLVTIADALNLETDSDPVTLWPRTNFWKILLATTTVLFVQLLLGAILRHTHALAMLHLVWALAVTVKITIISSRILGDGRFPRALSQPAFPLALLITAQLILGAGALWITKSPPSTEFSWRMTLPTAHVAVGAAMLALLSTLTLRAWRLEMSNDEYRMRNSSE
ncbi:MAG: COX15/CtaA family protein [Elusimicrobia bacterium]|nr:COX15/CtaA family protein [Elusimicrobiota bacterium]